MDTCIECGKPLRRIPAGVSKNTGKPYQAFWACPDRHKQGKPQQQASQPSTSDSGSRDTFLAIFEELQEIRKILEWMQMNMMQEGKGVIGSSFDRPKQKEDIPIVEDEEDVEIKEIPF